jgi:hypothetical protein
VAILNGNSYFFLQGTYFSIGKKAGRVRKLCMGSK